MTTDPDIAAAAERWWFPERADKAYCDERRRIYDEAKGMTDAETVDHYNEGRKFRALWDHVGDAYEAYEPLAEAYLELRDRYLRENPSDDGEAVLREIRFNDGTLRLRVGVSGVGRVGVFMTRYGMRHESDNVYELFLCDVKTEGDVRRLCRALGVTLKESDDGK